MMWAATVDGFAVFGATVTALLLLGWVLSVWETRKQKRGGQSWAQHVDTALDVFDDGEPTIEFPALSESMVDARWQTITDQFRADTEGGYR